MGIDWLLGEVGGKAHQKRNDLEVHLETACRGVERIADQREASAGLQGWGTVVLGRRCTLAVAVERVVAGDEMEVVHDSSAVPGEKEVVRMDAHTVGEGFHGSPAEILMDDHREASRRKAVKCSANVILHSLG